MKIIKNYKEKVFDRKIIFSDVETIINNEKHKVVCIMLIEENDSIVKRFNNLSSFMAYRSLTLKI